MKARVKSTGEIVDVTRIVDRYVMTHHLHTITFEKDELDFDIEDEPDYWTRLEHQYAGMAMQAYIIASHISQFSFCEGDNDMRDCKNMAHALVEKMKEEK